MDFGADADGDGLPDGWELQFAPNLTVLNGAGDNDHDGFTNAEEFIADTNPLDPNSNLRLINMTKAAPLSPVTLRWASSPGRVYRIRSSASLLGIWQDTGIGLVSGDPGATTTRTFGGFPDATGFFVIEAVKPLAP